MRLLIDVNILIHQSYHLPTSLNVLHLIPPFHFPVPRRQLPIFLNIFHKFSTVAVFQGFFQKRKNQLYFFDEKLSLFSSAGYKFYFFRETAVP